MYYREDMRGMMFCFDVVCAFPFKLIRFATVALLFLLPSGLFSQEALKSAEEDYYDFLSLQGLANRPALNYRTLSDGQWQLEGAAAEGGHPWAGNNLGSTVTLWQAGSPADNWFARGLFQGLAMKVYGPEWYNSYNTAAPYGQNDGALWQGRGYNTSLTAGIRFEGYGFELTFRPQLSFSQNLAFDYIKPNYDAHDKNGNPTVYNGKASQYGYYGIASIDAPQRFGDKPFFVYDWGDSEVRWTWHSFTVGFGTQSIWLGPAKLNPILHSNNAPTYPKVDIGLRRQRVVLPWLGWHLGDVEFRGWWGKLSESDFFDNDDSNNHNLISGLSFAWALPGIFDGLSIGINRTMLSKWGDFSGYTLFEIFVPGLGTSGGADASDQRFSFTVDYVFPKVGFEVYLEWARNDFSPGMDFIIRYPFHTQGWTVGAQKAFDLPWNLQLQILLELTFLECSADYDRLINWASTFYAHHRVTQGYTNRGQWLGAGIGTGGNSQYLGFRLYHKKGSVDFFMQRRNPDLDYTMYIDSKRYPEDNPDTAGIAERNIRAMLDFGLKGEYYFCPSVKGCLAIILNDEHNPLNDSGNGSIYSKHRYNVSIQLSGKYQL